MFFVLSKTVSFLGMPLTIVTVLLLLSFFLRNAVWKKRCRYAGIGLLLFFSNPFLANEMMGLWETEPRSFESLRGYKIAVVLTGMTNPDIEPDDRVYFRRGADRAIHAVQMYKLGLTECILISGGVGRVVADVQPESHKLRDMMIMMGVDTAHIIVEDHSDNTHENAVGVAKVLASEAVDPNDCIMITSAFHMRRALACFKKQHIEMDTFSCDFYASPRDYYPDSLLVPTGEALMLWEKLFKEWIGLIAYKLAGYV